jgi:XRE family aerobic/anaerobic benzoate catabolism transcriptional regulator
MNKKATSSHPPDVSQDITDGDYLKFLGDQVRRARTRRGMTRKLLARDSGVSMRYLAQLESGKGNISILLLHRIARALDVPLEVLVLEGPEPPVDLVHTVEFLRRLPVEDLEHARQLLLRHFGGIDNASRHDRIALIGMRGAGKSTLGALLAKHLDVPFIELDRLIEEESGVTLSAIFDLYGQSGYRRLERQCLDQVLERRRRFVLSTGGSLVSEPATFQLLLTTCFTIWLRTSMEEYMQRVIAQGDMRPMADNREAMADLERILAAREPLYNKADETIDTSGRTVEESLALLLAALGTAPTAG